MTAAGFAANDALTATSLSSAATHARAGRGVTAHGNLLTGRVKGRATASDSDCRHGRLDHEQKEVSGMGLTDVQTLARPFRRGPRLRLTARLTD